MYLELHRWDDALDVAERKCAQPFVAVLRQKYFEYLQASEQEEKAGELKEKEGDLGMAIHLYLKGGAPVKAAELAVRDDSLRHDQALLNKIANALMRNGFFEQVCMGPLLLPVSCCAVLCCVGFVWIGFALDCRPSFFAFLFLLSSQAGSFMEKIGASDKALAAYCKARLPSLSLSLTYPLISSPLSPVLCCIA